MVSWQGPRNAVVRKGAEFLGYEEPEQSGDIAAWVLAHGGYPTTGYLVMTFHDAKRFWPVCGPGLEEN